ncbi:hypothetical protein [Streptomyces sp. NPDC014894]|uniref:hypothetical protein n=1 Tax=Streptomyces sp. NPDC014894 TaxID=3364931 RepID=UPI0036FD7563
MNPLSPPPHAGPRDRAVILPNGLLRLDPARPLLPDPPGVWPDEIVVPLLMTRALTAMGQVANDGRLS